MENKTAILTGAAGFAGIHLLKALLNEGYTVYAVVRKGSAHNKRLYDGNLFKADEMPGKLIMTEIADSDYKSLPGLTGNDCEYFFHMASIPGRDDEQAATQNIKDIQEAVKAAKKLGCRRFIGTGSQAEYGIVDGLITEELPPEPFSAYGRSKAQMCSISKALCKEIGMEWVWGRIFSLIGEYEPEGRLIPDMIKCLKNGGEFNTSAATQQWDYLDAGDCARAFIALAERAVSGESYNVANGDHHELKYYTELLKKRFGGNVIYGEEAANRVSLNASVDKIKRDTGWMAKISFMETIERVYG